MPEYAELIWRALSFNLTIFEYRYFVSFIEEVRLTGGKNHQPRFEEAFRTFVKYLIGIFRSNIFECIINKNKISMSIYGPGEADSYLELRRKMCAASFNSCFNSFTQILQVLVQS